MSEKLINCTIDTNALEQFGYSFSMEISQSSYVKLFSLFSEEPLFSRSSSSICCIVFESWDGEISSVFSYSSSPSAIIGSLNPKVLPSPGLLVTNTLPLWCFSMAIFTR